MDFLGRSFRNKLFILSAVVVLATVGFVVHQVRSLGDSVQEMNAGTHAGAVLAQKLLDQSASNEVVVTEAPDEAPSPEESYKFCADWTTRSPQADRDFVFRWLTATLTLNHLGEKDFNCMMQALDPIVAATNAACAASDSNDAFVSKAAADIFQSFVQTCAPKKPKKE